ncbi:hypothetical protein [Almyronema epifaneia]|uniref:Uncharacterized protein n=1 Tax=Almyronema epifaneia S1 TaxID=2991925 RepID=A0ABW6IHI5_9CYAN
MLYFLPASFVFSVMVYGFAKDESAAKNDLGLWFVILLATILWPVTLPSILLKKVFQKAAPENEAEWVSV